jgi:hypothetical protein
MASVPRGLCLPFPQKEFAVIRTWSPFHPFHWARLRGNSCALRLRVFCFSVSSLKLFVHTNEASCTKETRLMPLPGGYFGS